MKDLHTVSRYEKLRKHQKQYDVSSKYSEQNENIIQQSHFLMSLQKKQNQADKGMLICIAFEELCIIVKMWGKIKYLLSYNR